MSSKRILLQTLFVFGCSFSLSFSALPPASRPASPASTQNQRDESNRVAHTQDIAGFQTRVAVTPAQQSATASVQHLASVMDEFHDRFPVYEDVSSAGNHFSTYTKIPDANAPVTINGSDTSMPHSGATDLRCEFLTGGGAFGGYYFQNGVLPSGQTVPQPNFGTEPNAGITELADAVDLTFWARGVTGTEKIDFFMGGVGRNAITGQVLNPCTPTFPGPCPAPDSTPRRPAFGMVFMLSTTWEQHTIHLSGANLSYVLGGFGWVASLANNPSGAVFYLDDIEYTLSPVAREARLNQPRFLRSYETEPYQSQPSAGDFDFRFRNTAYTYDNAVALLAFLADGTPDSQRRARLIGDALVYASLHDRFYNDGRFRNIYAAGDIALPPGWTPNGRSATVPIPGFYTEPPPEFHEVGQETIDTGNNAWAMIALLALYRRIPDPAYLNAARRAGLFLEGFRNNAGTYQGFQLGLSNPESGSPTPLVPASAEHNLDLFAAYRALYKFTGEARWRDDAEHARQFVEAMWDTTRGCYLTGTIDPSTPNTVPGQLPLDVQAWSVLALPNTLGLHPQALNCAELNHRTMRDGFDGYDFNDDRDGVWFEGTGQMATAYAIAGQPTMAESIRAELRRAQQTAPFGDGYGIVAASHDGVTSGFGFSYFRRRHVGATAWNVFAQKGFNPYYLFAQSGFDFEGDGKTDTAVFRPGNATWYLLQSSDNTFTGVQFGAGSDLIVPEDYDGDAKTDIAVFRAGTWYMLLSASGTLRGLAFGASGDVPVPADYDGDGRADVAVFRQGVWYVLRSSDNEFVAVQWGTNGDKAVPGNYDGDGQTDFAVYRPGTGAWYVLPSSGGFIAQSFGNSTDRPTQGDYDGDGKSDLAVFRPSSATWYILQSTNNLLRAQAFGLTTDVPVPADYDGDRKADIAVYRSGAWYALRSSNNGLYTQQFGAGGDIPAPSAYLP